MRADFEVELFEGWQYVKPTNPRAKAWLDAHEPEETYECPCARCDLRCYRPRGGALLIASARAAGFALAETTGHADARRN